MALEIDLSDRVVLVTGGVRGVGAGISRVLLAAGATVVACARRPADEPIVVNGRAVDFVPCDVRDAEAVRSMIDEVVRRHGRLDHAVNNAGGAPYALAADASPRFHSKIIELNLVAALHVAQAAHAVISRQETGGSIVNISSLSGHRPSPGTAAYGAAKAGVDALTVSLAAEWAPRVRINSVVVGAAETELSELHYGDAAGVAAVGRTIPMGRLARPEDVGNGVAFLLSPLAGYISGATLQIHGGGEPPAFLSAATATHSTDAANTGSAHR